MQKTIRLHRQHDMDLISLYRVKGFNFTHEMKSALRACANGTDYKIRVPKQDYRPGYIKRSIHLHISLDPKRDADIIGLLGDVRQGQGNAFMKAVFRNCLEYIPFRAYGKGSGFAMSIGEIDDGMDPVPEPERERYAPGERPASVERKPTRTSTASQKHTQKKKTVAKDQEYLPERKSAGQKSSSATEQIIGQISGNMPASNKNNYNSGTGYPRQGKNTPYGSNADEGKPYLDHAASNVIDSQLPFDNDGNVAESSNMDDRNVSAVPADDNTNSSEDAFSLMDDLFEQMDKLTH